MADSPLETLRIGEDKVARFVSGYAVQGIIRIGVQPLRPHFHPESKTPARDAGTLARQAQTLARRRVDGVHAHPEVVLDTGEKRTFVHAGQCNPDAHGIP